MRVLLLGGEGQLGREIAAAFAGHEVVAPPHAALDIRDAAAVEEAVRRERPAAVISSAAWADVDGCERDPRLAFEINGRSPLALGRACRTSGSRLLHVSTDYVFDGEAGRPYEESDAPRPVCVYGKSKLAGERAVIDEAGDLAIVVRTAALFGVHPCRSRPGGAGFVRAILERGRRGETLRVVDDHRVCATSATDLARQIRVLVERDAPPGVYHAVNEPGMSWWDLARLALSMAGIDAPVEPIRASEFPSLARRPPDSRLATTRLRISGLHRLRPIEDALAEYLALAGYTARASSP